MLSRNIVDTFTHKYGLDWESFPLRGERREEGNEREGFVPLGRRKEGER